MLDGNLADSREREVKNSHLKVVFGDVTEENKSTTALHKKSCLSIA